MQAKLLKQARRRMSSGIRIIRTRKHPTLIDLPIRRRPGREVENDPSFEVIVNLVLSDDDLTEIRRAIESEVLEGNRALKAVKEIQVSESRVGLIPKGKETHLN